MASHTNKPKLIIDGKRADGRGLNDLREIEIQAHVLNDAKGSALIKWGNNKILAGVYGPRECIPKHSQSLYRSIVKCRYNMAPFCSKEEHGRSGPSRRSVELSKVIRETFENVIIAEAYPKTQIDIYLEVLQSDGGTRCAAVTAAAVALADAGIPMKDLVCAVAVGKIDGEVAADFSKDEDNYGESDMPIAIAPRNGDILLFQMDGLLTKDEVMQGIGMVKEAAKIIHQKQVDALKAVYDRQAQTTQLDMNI
ncbi:MAG: exosome complex exonuclease Rrp41 [Candidatus Micrarchaeia archaeon]